MVTQQSKLAAAIGVLCNSKANVRGLAAGARNINWYALTIPNDSWGFQSLYDDQTPKSAFYAYQVLTSELSGWEYARTLDVPNVEGYIFQNLSQQEKAVAWGSGTLTFAPAGQLRVVDRKGNVMFAVEVQLSSDPIFVTISN